MEELIYMNELFCLDAKRHTLKEEGKKVPLTEKGAQVLLELVEHEGEVVAKADLIEKIWGESRYKGNYVEQKIRELREVFRDDPKDPKYIMTAPGDGYKFVARVKRVPRTDQINDDHSNEERVANVAQGQGKVSTGESKGWSVFMFLMLLLSIICKVVIIRDSKELWR